MAKTGPKPKGKVKIKWSSEFAYAIGLITTDGSLSKDGRHISFVSNDLEQIENLKVCLGISNKIGKHNSGSSRIQRGSHVQFGDVLFYNFLLEIGLTPNKSKTLGSLDIPNKYFFDFLRGHFDGDGSSYSYWDKRWRSSFMFYMTFLSASMEHILWLREKISKKLNIIGHISKTKTNSAISLRYSKYEAIKLINALYRNKFPRLTRKYLKIRKTLAIIDKQQK